MLVIAINLKIDDPFQAAQEFIEANELSQGYLEEIAGFIQKNAKAVTIGAHENSSEFQDPFTGAGRYVPGGSTTPANAAPVRSSLIPQVVTNSNYRLN